MLLLYKALFSLLIAVPSWFGLVSSGHEIQVRIPVWNVGNIFSDFLKGHPTSTRRPTRPPTTSTRPPTTSTKPTERPTRPTESPGRAPIPTRNICDLYPDLPACQEEVTPEPSICDFYPHLPLCQEETKPQEPSLCDNYPELPECEVKSVRHSTDVGSLRWSADPNFCLYYPNLCSSPDESAFVPLVDNQGRSLLLILPDERGTKVLASGRSDTKWLGPTRRPAWQRQSKKNQDK